MGKWQVGESAEGGWLSDCSYSALLRRQGGSGPFFDKAPFAELPREPVKLTFRI